jgi:hypothetical protein
MLMAGGGVQRATRRERGRERDVHEIGVDGEWRHARWASYISALLQTYRLFFHPTSHSVPSITQLASLTMPTISKGDYILVSGASGFIAA